MTAKKIKDKGLTDKEAVENLHFWLLKPIVYPKGKERKSTTGQLLKDFSCNKEKIGV